MKNYLVAEDNEAVRRVLMRSLEGPETRVIGVADGSKALTEALGQKPDIIILDVRMPGLNGFQVCRALREDPVTCSIPVLMLTGLDDPRYELEGLDCGANDYIPKPFHLEELQARVAALLRRSP